MLTSEHCRGDPKFADIQSSTALLRIGDEGYAVRLLQQGLIDLGHPMPRSTARYGACDGIFGSETKGAVKAFQRTHGLSADGIVGPKTLAAFDHASAALPGGLAPVAALPASAAGGTGDPAGQFRDLCVEVIGAGGGMWALDWELAWKPGEKAAPLSFRVSGFGDYGMSLTHVIALGTLKFVRIVQKTPSFAARYVPTATRIGRKRIDANSVVVVNTIETTFPYKVLAVHELTHALLDMNRGPRNFLFNEMVAYVAGSIFILQNGGTSTASGPQKAIYERAGAVADHLRKGDTPPEEAVDALAKAILAYKPYAHSRHAKVINDGIPLS